MIFAAGFLALFLLLWLMFVGVTPLIGKLLDRSAHFTTKFRYRDYLPVFVVIAIGIAVTAWAGDGFLDLAESMQQNNPELGHADRLAHGWARENRTQGSTLFFTAMTIIGTPVGLGVLVAIASVALFVKRRWRWAAYLIFTSVVGGFLNLGLKGFFERARPELAEALRQAHGYSFPSGHAMGSTIVCGAFAYLAFRILRGRPRAAALALCVTVMLSISASRIYLGVHWISDVAAGITAGLLWLVTTTVAYETFRRIRLVRAMRARATEKAGQ